MFNFFQVKIILTYKIFSSQDLSLSLILFLLKVKKFKEAVDENTHGKNHIEPKKCFKGVDFPAVLLVLDTYSMLERIIMPRIDIFIQ